MKNFIKNNWKKVGLIIYIFIIPIISFADGKESTCDPTKGQICNPLADSGVNSIPEFIKLILQNAIKIGIPIIALALIYSGFLFVKARGNSEEVGKAKDALMYTLIGAAILLGSYAIAEMIQSTVTSLSINLVSLLA